MIIKGVKQGTPKWHAQRLLGIGASEVSALFDIDHPGYAMSAWTLAKVKRGELAAEEVFAGDKDLAAAGLVREPMIAKVIAAQRGWKIRPGGYVIDDIEPRMRASLDYIIEEPTDLDRKRLGKKVSGPGVLQIKSVISYQFYRLWTPDRQPAHVYYQVQQEATATKFEWTVTAAELHGPESTLEVRDYLTAADQRFGDRLRRNIAGFWDRCIIGHEIPPIDGSESSRLALRKLYKPEDMLRGFMDCTHDRRLDEAITLWDSARARRMAAEKDEALEANRLREILGTRTDLFTERWKFKHQVSEYRRTMTATARKTILAPGEA